jgi:hypothetical protein
MTHVFRARTALLLFIALGACYRYAPVELAQLQPGMSVRMDLSAVAVDRLRSGGSDQARLVNDFSVTGRVLRLAGDSIALAVPTSVLDAQARPQTLEHDLGLLRTDVQRARLRTLDRGRTRWAVVALGAVAIGSIAFALQRGGRSSGTVPNGPDPVDARVPLFSRE